MKLVKHKFAFAGVGDTTNMADFDTFRLECPARGRLVRCTASLKADGDGFVWIFLENTATRVESADACVLYYHNPSWPLPGAIVPPGYHITLPTTGTGIVHRGTCRFDWPVPVAQANVRCAVGGLPGVKPPWEVFGTFVMLVDEPDPPDEAIDGELVIVELELDEAARA